MEQPVAANYWQQIGLDYGSQRLAQLPWQWTHLAIDCAWTYIPCGGASPHRDILLAVPASLQSPITRCLLAQGAWFELELEFWQAYIQPGMSVIDIGAGVGIYTFSAAQIGKNVMVYAIEPFSGSIDFLDETCRINQIENVKIFKNAIDNRDRQAQLVLQASSELNYLLAVDETKVGTETEAVVCLTLDRFIQQAAIERVDLVKISTDGNELAILSGGEQTIAKFRPTIIYNSYTSKGIDLTVAEYLLDRDYELFCYQPDLPQLIPLVNESDFSEVIKAIAMPKIRSLS